MFENKISDIDFNNAIQIDQNQIPVYYIFNEKNGNGFILISANNLMLPVLGYSFSGSFEKEKTNPSLEYLLNKYVENINLAIENGAQDAHVKEAWEYFKTDSQLMAPAVFVNLITTSWDQDCYYNLYAPSDISGPCSHAYAGCVATSMSMVMKYHNYPAIGFGMHSYTHPSYGNLSANFGSTNYAWTNMPNQLNSSSALTQKQSIARLMADCGIAVDMNYGSNGSGSNIGFSADALSSYFRYNYSSNEEMASNYSSLEWGQILRDQLDNNMPIIYSGIDNTIGYGHAWGVDGYQGSNYFHMNWGWSGYNNGYYLLTYLNVAGYNFNSTQSAVINIKPANINCQGQTKYITKTGRIEDGSGVENYGNNLNCSYLIEPISGNLVVLTFTEFNTEASQDVVTVYDGNSSSGTLLGTFSGNSIPPVLMANSGKMYISFTTNSSVNAAGWKASWSQTMPVYCTNLKFMSDPTATFDDGSGNSPYLNNAQCKWLLKPLGATTVSLVFHEFDLHSSDHLYVYNGANTGTQLIGSYTGSTLPPNIRSTGNALLLYFVSGTSFVAGGWKVSYYKDALSANDLENNKSFKIYPNPANNNLNIESINNNNIDRIYIFTSQGQLVKTMEATENRNSVINIDIQNLAKGFYIIQLIGEDFNSTKTFIKE